MSNIYVVFNELSTSADFRPSTATKHEANQWLFEFNKLIKLAEQENLAGLRTYHHPYQIYLTEEYTLQDWFQDEAFPRDLRVSVQDRFARLSRVPEFPENQQGNPLVEYLYQGHPAHGLGAAHQLESLAISLPTGNEHWQTDTIALFCREFVELEEGEDFAEQESEPQVGHISQPAHLQQQKVWIEERLKTSVRNGRDLLQKAATLYPHLIFCAKAHEQIKAIKANDQLFSRIINRLLDLENYCKGWDEHGFDGKKILNASPEGEAAMQQFGSQRRFVCPDGETRDFEWHLKENFYGWRIHIWPDEQGAFGLAPDGHRKILVGYVGPHLSTKKHP